MNVVDVKTAVWALKNAGITPMIVGHHGIGKSSIVKELGADKGYKVIDLRLGNMEIGDLLGLPDLRDGATHFNPPEWFPRGENDKVILFLDEINRARRDVLQAVFQLVLDRKLGQATLPKECFVVAAMNPDSDDYTVSHFSDKAFLSRFCHIVVESSPATWLKYAKSSGLHSTVVDFISSQPSMLRATQKDISLSFVKPCDRSVTMVSNLLQNNPDLDEGIRNELIVGLVGSEWLGAFINFENSMSKPLTAEQILKDYKKYQADVVKMREQVRVDYLNASHDNLMEGLEGRHTDLTDKQLDNVVAFLCDLPDDLLMKSLTNIFNNPPSILVVKKIGEQLSTTGSGGPMKERTKNFPRKSIKLTGGNA